MDNAGDCKRKRQRLKTFDRTRSVDLRDWILATILTRVTGLKDVCCLEQQCNAGRKKVMTAVVEKSGFPQPQKNESMIDDFNRGGENVRTILRSLRLDFCYTGTPRR